MSVRPLTTWIERLSLEQAVPPRCVGLSPAQRSSRRRDLDVGRPAAARHSKASAPQAARARRVPARACSGHLVLDLPGGGSVYCRVPSSFAGRVALRGLPPPASLSAIAFLTRPNNAAAADRPIPRSKWGGIVWQGGSGALAGRSRWPAAEPLSVRPLTTWIDRLSLELAVSPSLHWLVPGTTLEPSPRSRCRPACGRSPLQGFGAPDRTGKAGAGQGVFRPSRPRSSGLRVSFLPRLSSFAARVALRGLPPPAALSAIPFLTRPNKALAADSPTARFKCGSVWRRRSAAFRWRSAGCS